MGGEARETTAPRRRPKVRPPHLPVVVVGGEVQATKHYYCDRCTVELRNNRYEVLRWGAASMIAARK